MIPIKDNIPTDRFPVVTVLLMLVNVVAYLAAVAHGGSLISGPDLHEMQHLGAVPFAITHPGQHCGVGGTFGCSQAAALSDGLPWWQTVITSLFVHGSILHLAVDLLFLWIFGNTVEDSMGRARFAAFYLLGGVAAVGLQTAVDPDATAPLLAASGAVATVLGGYVLLYPRARVLSLSVVPLLFTVVELPVLVMLVIWFAVQVAFGATGVISTGTGVVAEFGHVGGLLFGLLTVRWLATRRRPTPPTRVVTVA